MQSRIAQNITIMCVILKISWLDNPADPVDDLGEHVPVVPLYLLAAVCFSGSEANHNTGWNSGAVWIRVFIHSFLMLLGMLMFWVHKCVNSDECMPIGCRLLQRVHVRHCKQCFTHGTDRCNSLTDRHLCTGWQIFISSHRRNNHFVARICSMVRVDHCMCAAGTGAGRYYPVVDYHRQKTSTWCSVCRLVFHFVCCVCILIVWWLSTELFKIWVQAYKLHFYNQY